MAGGRSERMRATSGPQHKALVEVAGISLIERNLIALYAAGVRDVVVAISRNEPAIQEFVADRGRSVARRFGGALETFIESEPLGNIGVVADLNDNVHDLLVVYVDNLTSIPLEELLTRHSATSASLTITARRWELRNPFGELAIVDGCVRSYIEKPVRTVTISSGTCIVAPAAAALATARRPFGASDLCSAALAAGLTVVAFEHEGPWIDVNDAQGLAEAEELVHANPSCFSL